MCFPIVLEARIPKPRCRDDWFLERTPSLARRWPPSVCIPIWLFLCVWDERTLVSFPLRTPVQSGQGSTLRISFHLCEVAQSCPTLCDPMEPTKLLRPWDFPGKSTGAGCHFLFQEIFLTQGLNPGLPQCRHFTVWATRDAMGVTQSECWIHHFA